MRLWSLHPKYLDAKGLVALWREALLAQKVLRGETVGYKKHPQLLRFAKNPNPIASIGFYLKQVLTEAKLRGYKFNSELIHQKVSSAPSIPVTTGQVAFEFEHLKTKLETRDPKLLKKLRREKVVDVNPLFKRVDGPIESFEKVY